MANRKHRGRSKGRIFFRESDGLWVGSVSLGYDDNGRRKQRDRLGKSRGEVQDECTSFRNRPPKEACRFRQFDCCSVS